MQKRTSLSKVLGMTMRTSCSRSSTLIVPSWDWAICLRMEKEFCHNLRSQLHAGNNVLTQRDEYNRRKHNYNAPE